MDNLPQVQFKLAWQTYRVGDRIRPVASLRDWLMANGYVELVSIEEVETPSRPAKVARAAAAKVVSAKRSLFGGS